jgi:hypothetical protein
VGENEPGVNEVVAVPWRLVARHVVLQELVCVRAAQPGGVDVGGDDGAFRRDLSGEPRGYAGAACAHLPAAPARLDPERPEVLERPVVKDGGECLKTSLRVGCSVVEEVSLLGHAAP